MDVTESRSPGFKHLCIPRPGDLRRRHTLQPALASPPRAINPISSVAEHMRNADQVKTVSRPVRELPSSSKWRPLVAGLLGDPSGVSWGSGGSGWCGAVARGIIVYQRSSRWPLTLLVGPLSGHQRNPLLWPRPDETRPRCPRPKIAQPGSSKGRSRRPSKTARRLRDCLNEALADSFLAAPHQSRETVSICGRS
jgi:hypothetical protein